MITHEHNRTSIQPKVSPGSPYSAREPDGTTQQANPAETLHVGQSGHTSDFEWIFLDIGGDLGGVERPKD
jgi:hypothetical protein